MTLAEADELPSNTLAVALHNVREDLEVRRKYRRYRTDPVGWMKERLGVTLWSKQRDVAMSLVDNKQTAVKSGHGVGKSKLASLLVQWWIDVHVGEDVMVVTTAPSNDQVTGILWEYIRKSHNAHGLTGTVTEDAKWKDNQRNIIGIGRKPADSVKGESSFQGRHYKYTLVIVDEACGITKSLFDAVNAIVTTDTCRILVIGNPTDPNTEFGRIFLSNAGKGDSDWAKHTISVLDNPNFTGELVPQEIYEVLTSRAWVEALVAKRGKDSVDYLARVLGEFPTAAEDSLFPLPLLYQSIDLPLVAQETDYCTIGVDVARYGSDRSTAVKFKGGVAEILGTWRNLNGPELAMKVHNLAVEHNAQEVRIDTTGVGVSVFDAIVPLSLNFYDVIGMVGSAKSPDITKWLNARAYWHDFAKQLMLQKKLKLPNTFQDEDAQTLFDELSGITYKIHLVYQCLQISSKEELRRAGMDSPDISDALMYAVAPIDLDNPLLGYDPGDIVSMRAEDMVDEFAMQGFVISPV